MTAKISKSDTDKQVLLEFEFERYSLPPEEAKRIGAELIKKATIVEDPEDD